MAVVRDLSTSGSITTGTRPTSGVICPPGVISGMSILKFGKSLPLIELFETFMITGFVLIAVTGSSYFTFTNISEILKTEGASPTAVNIALSAAHSQPAWIVTGLILFIVGVIMYYLHRRIASSPS